MGIDLLVCPKEYFTETVNFALQERKVDTCPTVALYISNLLYTYMLTQNLYKVDSDGHPQKDTLAEQLLKAAQAGKNKKIDMLRDLGDTSLYISGFFGDSLKRKVVDIDYYVDIGGTAYGTLSACLKKTPPSFVYQEISERFMEFVDVLTLISQQALIQTNSDLLRLYDRYLTTDSQLAREQLAEKGLLNQQTIKKKVG